MRQLDDPEASRPLRQVALCCRVSPSGLVVCLELRAGSTQSGAKFWGLPQLRDVPPHGALEAGLWPSPAWSPAQAGTQVYLLSSRPGAPADFEQLLAWPAGAQRTWLTPSAALAAHAEGVVSLALPWVVSLRILHEALMEAAWAPPANPLGVLRAAARALADCDKEAAARGPQVPGICALPLRSPTLLPATHTNCYLVGEKALAVIDPGTPYPADQDAFVGHLQQRVAQGATISQTWITHHHPDHVGAALRLKTVFGAPIMAHADTAAALGEQVPVDVRIQDGQILTLDDEVFTALLTPGHARGHLCFWRHRGGHLFSGDNVLGTGTPLVPPAPHGDMGDYMDSLKRLLQLELGLLFPGHGPPCATSAARVMATLKAREQRENLLLATLRQARAPQTLAELVARVYRGLGASLRGLAELATLAHLEKLERDGLVHKQIPTSSNASAQKLYTAIP